MSDKLTRMDSARPSPHHPRPGSVRPQDAPRLLRLRTRPVGRWRRRQRRQLIYLTLAIAALAATATLVIAFFTTPAEGALHRSIELIALGALLPAPSRSPSMPCGASTAHGGARAARIRLHHVEHRLASLHPAADGVTGEHPVA